MALTKSTTVLDAVQEIASAGIVEGTIADISGSYNASLYIFYAPGATTANTVAAKAQIQVSPETTGDASWSILAELVFGVVTSEEEAITNNPLSAAATSITMASTTNLVVGNHILLKDATPANSEFHTIVAVSANTSITIQDGVAVEHANTAKVYNQSERRAPILLPFSAQRVRVIYYGATGPVTYWKSVLVNVTAV